jgi:hypothetical protein
MNLLCRNNANLSGGRVEWPRAAQDQIEPQGPASFQREQNGRHRDQQASGNQQ